MTRRTDLTTLRRYFAWKSIWFQNTFYQGLVIRDLVIDTYLSSLCRRLQIVSGHFTVRSTIFNINTIETQLFFLKKSNIMKHFFVDSCFYERIIKLLSILRFPEISTFNSSISASRTLLHQNIFVNFRSYVFLLIHTYLEPSTFSTMDVNFFFFKIDSYHFFSSTVQDTSLYRQNFFFSFLVYYYSSLKSLGRLTYGSNKHHVRKQKAQTPPVVTQWAIPIPIPIRFFSVFGLPSFFKYDGVAFDASYFSKFYSSVLEKSFRFVDSYWTILLRNRVFLYWISKSIWISFFNRLFLSLASTGFVCSFSLVDSLYTKLTSLYNFVYVSHMRIFNPFFRNQLYMTLVNQFYLLLTRTDYISIRFFKNSLSYLFREIELTIRSYTGSLFFFVPDVSFYYKSGMTDAKIVCEYMRFKLLAGWTVSSVYSKIHSWQLNQMKFKHRKFQSHRKETQSSEYKNPLKGIRIIVSGPPYKARRKIRKRYHLWLAREYVTGRMPLQSIKYDIDYYQSYVRIRRSALGLKVWTLFETTNDKILW